jgi:predicted AlkP superfamily phosphohydrolase/phosphomutase
MRFFRGRRKKTACVVGLDGVPFGLLRQLADRSVMPRVAEIIRGGGLKQMRASLPPVSSVSWSCFMTGANPGEHGIFGFTDVAPDTLQLRFPNFSDLAMPTFWDRLGESGRRCAVINQPSTYPAREMPGVLVSGFVALDLDKSVWPGEQLPALKRMGYRIDVDSQKARSDPDGLLDDLHATLGTRRKAARHFWDLERWDYFQVVVTGTDRLHHFLWNAVEQQDDPRHERAMAYYRAVDALIGEVWDLFHQGKSADREGEGFLLLSDHGFCAVQRDVRLNAWLRENGYLDYQSEDPKSVAEIAPTSRAFALDPGRIHLNLKGRFGKGCVEPDEAPALRQELAARLKELSFEGEPVISHIFSREQAFRGPRTPLGPDLVVLSHPGFDLKGTTRGDEVVASTHFQGMHTWDDAFVWSLLPVPDGPEISDLAGVLVQWLSH